MDIKTLKTRSDYRMALREIENLMGARPKTGQGERLDLLVALVEAYEARHHAIDLPDPVGAIKFQKNRGQTAIFRSDPWPHGTGQKIAV